MEDQFLRSMNRSIDSAIAETNNFIGYFDRNLYKILFSPTIISADIDYQSYCKLLLAIKKEAGSISSQSELFMIFDQAKTIPDLNPEEFRINGSLPSVLTYILLPIGIVYSIGYYLKITGLVNKLRIIESKMQSMAFSIKVNLD